LVALRGRVFVKYFLMFMSTVQHLLEQQKEEQERNASKISESESGGDLREISSVVSDPEEGQR
jgi:hypothetical protein